MKKLNIKDILFGAGLLSVLLTSITNIFISCNGYREESKLLNQQTAQQIVVIQYDSLQDLLKEIVKINSTVLTAPVEYSDQSYERYQSQLDSAFISHKNATQELFKLYNSNAYMLSLDSRTEIDSILLSIKELEEVKNNKIKNYESPKSVNETFNENISTLYSIYQKEFQFRTQLERNVKSDIVNIRKDIFSSE